MYSKWKEIKKELNVSRRDIYEIYKNQDNDWKVHLRDEDNVWVELTFFMEKRLVLGTYYSSKDEESGTIYYFESF